jgi:ATP-binding cassette, subfamily B, bacterial MsbA
MDFKTLKILLNLVRCRIWVIPMLAALSILASLAEGLGVGLLIPFLHTLLGDAGSDGGAQGPVVAWLNWYAELFDEENRLAILALSIIALAVVRSAIVYADGAASSWIGSSISHRLRVALIRQILDVDYEYLCKTDNGKLLNTIEGETARTTAALGVVFGIITQISMVLVFTTLLLLISWQLTLAVAAGVLLISTLVRGIARRASRISTAAVLASQRLSERSVEVFDGMRIIRAFSQEGREERRFAEASDEVRRTEFRLDLLAGLVHPILEVLYAPVFIGVLLLAWHTEMSVPAALAFLLLLYRLQPHMKGLNHSRVHLATLSGGVRDVIALLDRSDKPYIVSGPRRFTGLKTGIAFRNVSFSYGSRQDAPPALDDVTFAIGKGEITALVGGSGAGKSTLINLLYRFYDPAAGIILVDGEPLPQLDLASWRAALTISGQDAELMSGTIAENIAYGDPRASRARIIEAARQASAHDFIAALPLKYETRVGQRGQLLSGGQRQRIALARALLLRPEILILDEATNALDSVTEAEIHETFEGLRNHCTMIVIAHRLGTIRNADRIVVLQDGRVVEAGRPRDLLCQNGLLARMHELQLLQRPVAS